MDIFKRSRRRKSGSLQLSINAIVILVMAMVVLGLGLTFIRGLFNKGTDNLGSVLDNTQLENPASPEDIITIDRVIQANRGETVPVRIGFYNKWTTQTIAPATAGGSPTGSPGGTSPLSCSGPNGDLNKGEVSLSSPGATVNNGEAKAFEALLTVSDGNNNIAAPGTGTYICTVQIFGGQGDWPGSNPSEQFRLEIVG